MCSLPVGANHHEVDVDPAAPLCGTVLENGQPAALGPPAVTDTSARSQLEVLLVRPAVRHTGAHRRTDSHE